MSCTISIKHPSSNVRARRTGGSPPHYDLCLEEVDKLVATIFTVVSVNPKFFTVGLKQAAKQWLNEENTESGLTKRMKLTSARWQRSRAPADPAQPGVSSRP